MVFSQFAAPLSCHEVQLFTSGYLEHDPSLSADQFAAIEEHLQGCEACREDYDTDHALIRLMQAHWPAICEKSSLLVVLICSPQPLRKDVGGREFEAILSNRRFLTLYVEFP